MFKVLQSGPTEKNHSLEKELISGINYFNYVVKKTDDCWVAIPNELKHLDLAILLKSKHPSIITGTDTADLGFLAEGKDIRLYSLVLPEPGPAGSPKPGLYLIEHEQ